MNKQELKNVIPLFDSLENCSEIKEIAFTRIEEDDTSCCQESFLTDTDQPALKNLSKQRKRKRRRKRRQIAASADKEGSKGMRKKNQGHAQEVPGIVKAAGGKGHAGDRGSTKTSTHSVSVSGEGYPNLSWVGMSSPKFQPPPYN